MSTINGMGNLEGITIAGGLAETAKRMFYFFTTPRRDWLTWPNLCVVSDPAEAKTMLVQAVARSLGVTNERSVRWSVGQHDMMDWNGWGVPRDEGLTFEAPAAIRRLINSTEPALFFADEANQATPTQQGAMLKWLDSRSIGDEKPMGTHIMTMLAMNPPETGSGSHDQTLPMRSRVLWLNYAGPTNEEHARFIKSRGGAPLTLPQRLGDDIIERSYDILCATYARYITTVGVLREDALSPQVTARAGSVDVGGQRVFLPSYATPRTWDIALQVAATAHAYGDEEAMLAFLIGAVGPHQGVEFMTFYREQDLIEPELILADVTLWNPDPKRPDRTFVQTLAVATAACSKAFAGKAAGDRWLAAWKCIERTMEAGEGKDMVAAAAEHLSLNIPKGMLLAKHVNIDTIRALSQVIVGSALQEVQS